MAETPKKDMQDKNTAGSAGDSAKKTSQESKSVALNIRLAPVNNSDQPIVANYVALNVAPGMVFIDFGFLEPGMLAALPRVAKQGGKLPETLDGKLATRVVMGYDALADLHQQLGRVIARLQAAGNPNKETNRSDV